MSGRERGLLAFVDACVSSCPVLGSVEMTPHAVYHSPFASPLSALVAIVVIQSINNKNSFFIISDNSLTIQHTPQKLSDQLE